MRRCAKATMLRHPTSKPGMPAPTIGAGTGARPEAKPVGVRKALVPLQGAGHAPICAAATCPLPFAVSTSATFVQVPLVLVTLNTISFAAPPLGLLKPSKRLMVWLNEPNPSSVPDPPLLGRVVAALDL